VCLTRIFALLFFLCSAIWAADPFVGTWKLNLERSDFGNGPKAKRGRASYTPDGNGYKYESVTVLDNGQIAKLVGPVKFDGTVYPGSLEGRAIEFTSKKIDRNNYRVLIADGVSRKVTQEFQYTVSSDNKTLTFSWLKGSEGRLVVYWVLVYERE
jgi:hypothetical protein